MLSQLWTPVSSPQKPRALLCWAPRSCPSRFCHLSCPATYGFHCSFASAHVRSTFVQQPHADGINFSVQGYVTPWASFFFRRRLTSLKIHFCETKDPEIDLRELQNATIRVQKDVPRSNLAHSTVCTILTTWTKTVNLRHLALPTKITLMLPSQQRLN